jgi:hypothetical protein
VLQRIVKISPRGELGIVPRSRLAETDDCEQQKTLQPAYVGNGGMVVNVGGKQMAIGLYFFVVCLSFEVKKATPKARIRAANPAPV